MEIEPEEKQENLVPDTDRRKESLLDEACRIVYLNYGNQAAQLYKAGLKDKAEKEVLSSLEESLKELVGPEHAEEQLKEIREKFNNKK